MHLIPIYIALFFGILFEGELVMISSIIAAHHGYLNLWLVVAIGMTGTFGSDCFYFFLRRKKGNAWLNKHQKFRDKAASIDAKLEKHPTLIFLSYWFLYGFRTITPFVIGNSKTKPNTFLIFSALSIVVWASVWTSAGYLFGEVIKSELTSIEHAEKYIIGILLFTGLVILLINRFKKSKKSAL